ncbi:hypothetical protein [Pseudogemmobacter sonorensis]|uniref:hypothetical protein n=1 Tax=Pseudogemmobacter sonorensis TaxID=2989681 RepID=UPI0036D05425
MTPRPQDPGLAPEDWRAFLDPGEALLWSGRPRAGLRYDRQVAARSSPGLFILAFALLWTGGAGAVAIAMVAQGGSAWRFVILGFPAFGLIFVWFGLEMLVLHWFRDAALRARTSYALTSRRALIHEGGHAPRLRSWPILPGTVIDYSPYTRHPPEVRILFATEEKVDADGDRTYTRTGFDRITEGARVMHLLRQVQTAQSPPRFDPHPDPSQDASPPEEP